MHRQAELLEIVAARASAGRFAGRLYRRQQQADEHTDDGDHHQKFHQGKPAGQA